MTNEIPLEGAREILMERWRAGLRADLLSKGVAGDKVDEMVARMEEILTEFKDSVRKERDEEA